MTDHQPWLASYDPGVPVSLEPYPERTLLDYLGETARARPEHPAVIFKGRRVTAGEIDHLSDQFAAALADLGVRKGDRVALMLPNCPQFIIAEFGAWKAGAVVAPLNPIYTAAEIEGPLRESGAKVVVTLTPYYERVKSVQAAAGVQTVVATNIKEYLPPALRLLFTLVKEKPGGHRIALQPGDHWFADLLRAHAGRTAPGPRPGPADPAVILMSGGTTGTPKGVLGTHAAFVQAGMQLLAWNRAIFTDWQDIVMLPLPLFHVYANVGVQSLAMVSHAPLALVPDPRDTHDLLRTIDRVRPAFFTGVPTLFIMMLNHPDVQKHRVDFSSIKICFSGAAPLMAETKKRFEALTGGRLIEGYSLTEAMMACTVNPLEGTNKVGSVGLPLPDVQVRIFDVDTGTTTLPVNEIGEIAICAPQLMRGFWGQEEETAGVLRHHADSGVWLHTGDLGYLDREGYLFIVDRKKDLIKTSGYQVWPREVEEVVATHPAVAEVGVAGVSDPVRGETVKAWVVLRTGHTLTVEELRTYCRQRLAPYKVPTQVEFRSSLPKTMVGKVLRRALVAGKA
ncbi:MAG: long-chain fatty acid--CoA ligase [Acidobacteriota bacterium]|nr:long-chain fatty acid--CoA ligase [Acidobacteriota bacterium]